MQLPTALSRFRRFNSESYIVILMLIAVPVLCVLEPKLLRFDNIINILRNASLLAILSIGQALVLLIGGFDLSVGAVIACSSVVSALTMIGVETSGIVTSVHLTITIGIAAGLLTGLLFGLANGLCVARLKVPAFVVTLGTMTIGIGVASYLSRGTSIYGLPDEFVIGLGRLRVFGVPYQVFLGAGIVASMYVVMNWTQLGRAIYAVGGNESAARLSGVQVERTILASFVICSVFASLVGLILTARVGSGEASLGANLMLECIAAAVVGGVLIGGGYGRVELVAMGAVFLSVLGNALNLMTVPSKLQLLVYGIVLILSALVAKLGRGGK